MATFIELILSIAALIVVPKSFHGMASLLMSACVCVYVRACICIYMFLFLLVYLSRRSSRKRSQIDFGPVIKDSTQRDLEIDAITEAEHEVEAERLRKVREGRLIEEQRRKELAMKKR